MAKTSTSGPPANVDAERWVLGAVLKEPARMSQLEDGLSAEDFFLEAHRHIYAAILDLFGRGVPLDVVSIAEQLQRSGMLEAIGGPLALRDMAQEVGTTVGLDHHLAIIREKSLIRRMITAATDIASEGYAPGVNIAEFLDAAEKRVFSVLTGGARKDIRRMSEILVSTMEMIQKQIEAGGRMTGIPTGFEQLDRILNGLQRSDLLILAARPAMGKTALALSMACHITLNEGRAAALFSLEMGAEQLVMRLLASEAHVDLKEIRGGRPGTDDFRRLSEAAARLSDAEFYIDDSPVSLAEVRARCRRLSLQGKLDLILIDYLQLMKPSSPNLPREQQISEISRGLKSLAKELNVPVVALSQVNRASEGRTDKRPMLSDLRESGAIEQDADVIMFVYRDEYYHPDSADKGVAEIIVAKQRNGPTDTARVAFVDRYAKFANLAPAAEF
jgi:replicative DNA helicase